MAELPKDCCGVRLEIEEGRRIQDVTYLSAEEKIPLDEMKLSIVGVRCIDEQNELMETPS